MKAEAKVNMYVPLSPEQAWALKVKQSKRVVMCYLIITISRTKNMPHRLLFIFKVHGSICGTILHLIIKYIRVVMYFCTAQFERWRT